MKTIQKLTFWSLLLLLAGVYACTPDSTENPQPDLLAGGSSKTWQMIDAKRDGLSSPNKVCLVGDLYTFRSDKTFTFDEGTEKCGSIQTVNGQWQLVNSVITIRQTGNQTFVVFKIKSLNSNRMVVEIDNNGGPVIEYTFTAL